MKKYAPIFILVTTSVIINFNLFIYPIWGFLTSIFGLVVIAMLTTASGIWALKKLKLSENQGIWTVAVLNFLLSIYGTLIIGYKDFILKDNLSLANSGRFVDEAIQKFQYYYVFGSLLSLVLVIFVSKSGWGQKLLRNIAVLLLIVTFFNRTYSYSTTLINLKPLEIIEPQKSPINVLPDIYFVLMDGYSGNTALKKYWKFDNTLFKDTLTKLGFTISDSARGRMPATIGSLSFTLNASDFQYPKFSLSNMDLVTRKYVTNNALYRVLEKNGYQIESKSIFWDDMPFFFGQGEIDPKFTFLCPVLTRNFVYRVLIKVYNTANSRNYTIANWFSDYDDKIELELNKQEKGVYAAEKAPHFVLNHLFYTHHIFRYDSAGKRLPTTQIGLWDPGYINQVKYNNNVCTKYFSNLIHTYKGAGKPLIIIAISDHGSRVSRTPDEDSQIQLMVFDSQNKLQIKSQQSGSVNLMRELLNQYFGYRLTKQPYNYHNYYIQ